MPKLFWYAVAALPTLLGVTLMLHGAHDSGLLLIAGLATAVLTRILRSHDAYHPPAATGRGAKNRTRSSAAVADNIMA